MLKWLLSSVRMSVILCILPISVAQSDEARSFGGCEDCYSNQACRAAVNSHHEVERKLGHPQEGWELVSCDCISLGYTEEDLEEMGESLKQSSWDCWAILRK